MNLEAIQAKQKEIIAERKTYEENIFKIFDGSIKAYKTHHEEQKPLISKLPNYWMYVIKNSDWIRDIPLSNVDIEVLKYLADVDIIKFQKKEIEHTILKDQTTIAVDITIQFTFKPNKYMHKLELQKSFTFNLNENNYPITDVTNSGIDMTDLFYNQLGSKDTFFDFFEFDDEEDDDDTIEQRRDFDLDICKKMFFDMVPFSFEYFRMIEEEEDDDDGYDDYDDYNEDRYDEDGFEYSDDDGYGDNDYYDEDGFEDSDDY